jgi:hypothetical protein
MDLFFLSIDEMIILEVLLKLYVALILLIHHLDLFSLSIDERIILEGNKKKKTGSQGSS